MDEEYHLGSEDEPVDDEATIEEQEKQENDDHQAEIDRLQVPKNLTAHNVRVSVSVSLRADPSPDLFSKPVYLSHFSSDCCLVKLTNPLPPPIAHQKFFQPHPIFIRDM